MRKKCMSKLKVWTKRENIFLKPNKNLGAEGYNNGTKNFTRTLNSKLDQAEETIRELRDRLFETIQSEEQKEWKRVK